MIKRKTLNAKIKLIDFPEPSKELKNKINEKIYKYGIIMDTNYLGYCKDDNIHDIDKIIDAINNIGLLSKESDFDELYMVLDNLGVTTEPAFEIEEQFSRVTNIDFIRKIFTDISNENIKSFDLFYDDIFSSLDKFLSSKNISLICVLSLRQYKDSDSPNF